MPFYLLRNWFLFKFTKLGIYLFLLAVTLQNITEIEQLKSTQSEICAKSGILGVRRGKINMYITNNDYHLLLLKILVVKFGH